MMKKVKDMTREEIDKILRSNNIFFSCIEDTLDELRAILKVCILDGTVKVITSYDGLDSDTFYGLLQEHLNRNFTRIELLQIPGVFEILSEYFNNEVLDLWTEKEIERITED